MMDELLFYKNCILALGIMKGNHEMGLYKIFPPDWFEKNENDESSYYGQICLSLKEAERRFQEILDNAKKEM